jgi:hypothetical protein
MYFLMNFRKLILTGTSSIRRRITKEEEELTAAEEEV